MKSNGLNQQENTLVAAKAGDQAAFERLVEPYRRELFVHCYRILASFEDAEDILQEILVRVWKHIDSFEGRSSLRAWLYKIATNACLDALDTRKRRGLPKELYARGDPTLPLPQPQTEATWIEPLPDEWISGQPDIYPESRYEKHESITMAFVAALQVLPGRQRAALLLRDVMGWSADEAAEILNMTPTAMNSALQRARASMKEIGRNRKLLANVLDEPLSRLLSRYVTAWEQADSAALVAILREDIALTMPPIPVWFGGRADVRVFLENVIFKSSDPFRVRLVPMKVNGSLAFAVYQRNQNGIYRAAAIHVLTIENGEISIIDDFLSFDGTLFEKLGLPLMV